MSTLISNFNSNIFLSAFCPYHIGHFSVVGLGFEEYVRITLVSLIHWKILVWMQFQHWWWSLIFLQVRASHFEGLITTIVGYVLLAITLIVCHVSFHCQQHLNKKKKTNLNTSYTTNMTSIFCQPLVITLCDISCPGIAPFYIGFWSDFKIRFH